MKPIEAYNHLEQVLSSDKFLNKEGIGNEVPFFIYPFDVRDTVEVYRNKENLLYQLRQKSITVLDLNLYGILIEYLEKENLLNYFLKEESSLTKQQFETYLVSSINFNNKFIPFIREKIEGKEFRILLLTGAGEVYPILRTHKILNNLQTIKNDRPTVLFFPGEYSYDLERGSNLNLFGRLHGDQYYRAFNLLNYKI